MNKETDAWGQHWKFASEAGVDAATVDVERYISPEVYKAECEKLFRRTWLLIGRESEVPNPGDFIKRPVYPLAAEAVIVRGKDGVIRAFHNACPHRGSALVRPEEGTTNVFVCPYHGWSYGTDGKCKAIPGADFFPQLDKRNITLPPIHTDVWNGFIYLNFDDTPRQSLKDYLGAFGELYDDVPFHEFPHCVELVQDIETNWKCFLDSFFEGYHVAVLHKTTLPMVPSRTNPFNVYYDVRLMPPHSSHIIQSNPDWVPEGEVLKFLLSATGNTMVRPLDGAETKPRETKLTACKGVNPVGLPHFGLRVLYSFPITQILIFEDRYMLQQFWPMGLDKTRFVLRFYSRSAPTSHLQAFADTQLVTTTRDVLSEDVAMTHLQQLGMKGGGLKKLYFGENELIIRHVHEAIQAYLNDGSSS